MRAHVQELIAAAATILAGKVHTVDEMHSRATWARDKMTYDTDED